ncbi:serine/threonine-protein kinase [Streptomyces reniochalinae]|uniref:non-specific serine/threonine protein kinase n=1 Tax=Streptomyces reniochalinae TaxID=2250578 RepID=A0A367ESG9_9ACTN|nr:serine/threonine-protein kinase [Streptomyces reniochalinae]RCG21068.1 serine/threonine protein kinase [Streptomyces reniochalinae]
MVPSTLIQDRYRLLELIGRGGMGEVWRAHDESLGRRVAVKCLKPLAQRGDAAFLRVVRERFRREARVAASLQHKGVTVVHDFGDDEGLLYLVMELLEGRNLSQLLEEGKRQPLPVPEVLDVAEQVSAALAYTHAQGVVHRDLKPANVMRTVDGTVKICDFGIARLAHDIGFTAKLTGTGIAMGTPHYMSPEQIAGTAVDHRSDLYSFGCVLYELATGAPPFAGGDAWSVLVGHRDAPPEPPRAHRPELPAPLEEVVLRLLSKAPQERPDDAADLSVQLAAARSFLPAWSARPAGHMGPVADPAVFMGPAVSVGAAFSVGPAAGEAVEWGGPAAREDPVAWEDPVVREGQGPGESGPGDVRKDEAAAEGRPPGPGSGPGEAAPLWTPGWARGMGGGLPAHGLVARRTPPWVGAEQSGLTGQWTGEGPARPPSADVASAAAVAVSGGGPRALSAEPRALPAEPRSPGAGNAAPAAPRPLAPGPAAVRRPAAHPPGTARSSGGVCSSGGLHSPGGAHPPGSVPPPGSAHSPGGGRPPAGARPAPSPALLAVLASRHSAGESLGRLGCWAEAYEAHAAVAAERHALLGACHPDTLTSRLAAGHALGRLGRWEEGWELCRGVALDRARIFGDEHPHTLSARDESAGCLRRLGRATEALELSRDLVAARTRVSGPAAPETLRALSGLGAGLGCLGRWEEALDVHRHVTSLRHRVLGPADPETLASRNEEAHCLERLGRGEEAARVYRALALES